VLKPIAESHRRNHGGAHEDSKLIVRASDDTDIAVMEGPDRRPDGGTQPLRSSLRRRPGHKLIPTAKRIGCAAIEVLLRHRRKTGGAGR